MRFKFTGLYIVLLGCLFAFVETAYFGHNWFPASVAEVICDGIALIIVVVGYVINIRDNRRFYRG